DEDDKGLTYSSPKGEMRTRRCEQCGKEIDIGAVVCVHCGYDFRKQEKAERSFHPIDREWEAGWPFERRLAVFLALQIINVTTLVLSVMVDGSVPVSIFGIVLSVALQAFLLGTYDRVRVRRNKKGQADITVTWRVGFVPKPPKRIHWQEYEGIAFGQSDPN